MKARTTLCVVLMLTALPTAIAQTVFRCTDAAGRVSFQQAPCDGRGTGAVAVKPANVVGGRPAGDAQVRRDAVRSAAVREAMARGEVIDGMTTAEVRQVLGEPAAVYTRMINGQSRQQLVYRYPDGSRRYVYAGNDGVEGLSEYQGSGRRSLQPCYSEQEIRNAETTASSVTMNPADKRAAESRVREMKSCVR